MDSPHNRQPEHLTPPTPTEAELRAAMDESERDIAAGRTVPLAEVLAELDDTVARMETRRRARQA